MAEERKLPREGGSRTLNPDGTEVKPVADKPKPKAVTTTAKTSKKPKE